MASVVATPPRQPDGPQGPPPAEYEGFIDGRLLRTRRHVKSVDIAGGLLTLAIGALAYLLAAAVLDHWLIAGGLDFWGRLGMLLLLLAAGGVYFALAVLPPLLHRINPIFAAQTIEQSQPTLKNSLINFLLLRNHRREVAPVVYLAVERRAAADLSHVSIDTAVDRGRIVRLGCVLAGLLAIGALYVFFSPKNPFVSMARIFWPWSNLAAPTRVNFETVRPGDAVAFHGDTLTVSADTSGLREGEAVTLHYSTAGGQDVDQTIPLTRLGEGNRYQCTLPPGNLGLQQDVEYWLAAGDCTTRHFHVEVQVAPAILIDRVEYHYPAYTGLPDRSVPGQGDLRAIEQTKVTIHATANRDIQRAEIDLDCSGQHSLKMDAAGRTASGQFTLLLDPDDPAKPQHESYQLLFTDAQGRASNRPIRYRIDVIRDLPPEISITSPQEEEMRVPVDGRLEIRLRALDPDFGLRRVLLRAECNGRSLSIPPLLDKVSPEKAYEGEFQAKYVFQPARLGLKAGDQVAYHAEAEDNREPTPNRSETSRRLITILDAEGRQPRSGEQPHRAEHKGQQSNSGDQGNRPEGEPNQGSPSKDNQPKDQQGEKQPGEKPQPGQENNPENKADNSQPQPGQEGGTPQPGQGKSQPKQGNAGQEQNGQGDKSASQSNEPVANDGTQDADAMDKINQQREKEQGSQQQQSGQQSNGSQQQQSGQQSNGSQQQQSGQQSNGSQQQQSGQQSNGSQQQQSGQQSNGSQQQQSGQQSNGSQPQQSGQQSNGSQPQQSGQQSNGSQPQQSGQQSNGSQPQQSGQQSNGSQPQQSGQQSNGSQPQQSGQQSNGSQPQQSGQQSNGSQPQQSGQQSNGSQPPSGSHSEQSGQQSNGSQPQQSGQQSNGSQPPSGSHSEQSGQQSNGSQPQNGPKNQPGNNPQNSASQLPGGQPKAGEKTQGGDQQGADQQRPSGENSQGEKKPEGGNSKSGEAQQQKTPGAGQKSQEKTGSPAPQDDNQAHSKNPGDSGQTQDHSAQDPAKSPSISPKESGSSGDTAGTQSGGGQKGGGQKTPQAGAGSEGSHTPSDEGGGKSNQKGQGQTGSKPGDQANSDHKPGSQANEKSTGSGQQQNQPGQPGGQPGGEQSPQGQNSPGGNSSNSNNAGAGQSGNQNTSKPGSQSSGNPTDGGVPGNHLGVPPEAAPKQTGGDEINQEYARKQTDLSLEYLKDQLSKDKSDLLEQLGWSREDAARFLKRWEQMERAAEQAGPQGEKARKSLAEAIKSLGLRPHGTQLRGGQTTRDSQQDLRDSGRFDPPADWAEQVREYTKGVATGGR